MMTLAGSGHHLIMRRRRRRRRRRKEGKNQIYRDSPLP
jgi:hypothetical protein